LGAIFAALSAGAHGRVGPERASGGMTDTVARAAAGALSSHPVANVTNFGARDGRSLKEAGYGVIGLDGTRE